MLVLCRKLNEKILIGDNVTLQVVEIEPGRVRLGISAPSNVRIFRSELVESARPSTLKREGGSHDR
jgi:carbon storage regulator